MEVFNTSVHAGDNISTVGDTSVLWRDSFSTVGNTAVHVRDNISTVGDAFSIVEVVQFRGNTFSTVEDFSTLGYTSSTCRGITSVQWETISVLWRVFSTVGDTFSTGGLASVLWGDNSTVEVIQYFEILRMFKESQNLFQSLFRFAIRSTTLQASSVDHG